MKTKETMWICVQDGNFRQNTMQYQRKLSIIKVLVTIE